MTTKNLSIIERQISTIKNNIYFENETKIFNNITDQMKSTKYF